MSTEQDVYNYLTQYDLFAGLGYLMDTNGLVVPFNTNPIIGDYKNESQLITREQWEAYSWNPSDDSGVSDPNASPKPDWLTLVANIAPAMLDILRPSFLRELRPECKRRITAAYGEGSFDDEIALRLRNGHTLAQDGERDRLRAAYQTLKGQIEVASYETLKTFSVQDEAHWAPPLENPE